ncbi:uncharacterized protein PHALS_03477 [Plasmopara halstedii]|uniref:Uncharacterized protein n=1 Tax=Plasmopara halstedii TaxID=4781 RepID=A0A0P1B013_PLAHL|nr:uncharacterized protein PHALS_03477 [Plasmopara halstedii]CEG46796.1 hypothetical protein PHALS_03477 [Plasmopara halstedii]|eukprot:XP_024583165.1 hypothetical protein PHALS_03477 [Plasmopara halstedii]
MRIGAEQANAQLGSCFQIMVALAVRQDFWRELTCHHNQANQQEPSTEESFIAGSA